MTLAPLWAAGPLIACHAFAAMLAAALGAVQLMRPKGGRAHRWMGWIFVGALMFVALSGLFIHEIRMIGPFSPIHLLSFISAGTLILAIRAIRRGETSRHASAMKSLYWQALIIAGLFTLLPGRAMNAVIFGG